MYSFIPSIRKRCAITLMTLALPATGFCQEAATTAQPVAISDRARELFRTGVDFMQDPDGARYEEAYHAFEAAYVESPSWKILGNLGITAMKLERDGKAIEALESYLKEGGSHLDSGEIEQVQRDLRILKTGVTYLTISLNKPGAHLIDQRSPFTGSPIKNRYTELAQELRIGVHAGRHQVTVELEGFETLTWKFEAKGEDLAHVFEFKKVEQPKAVLVPAPKKEPITETSRPITTPTWLTLGAAGALGAGAAVTGVLALQKNKDFEAANGVDPAEAERLKNSGKNLNLTTDILIGAAVVGAGAAAYLFFTRPEVTTVKDVSLNVVPTPLPQGGGVWLHGKF
jgi:hypothetical protein